MSGEKKHWRLSTPFRRKQGIQLQAKVGRSGSRVSSVYLSDDSSASHFIIVPEFDYPVQAHTTHEESEGHNPHLWPKLSTTKSPRPLSPNGVNGYPASLEPIGSQYSCIVKGSCDALVVNPCRADDLTQRLDFAYEHIRSMASAASPKVLLSSDPQMLRKQLGVPQHSVLNYPIHSSPDLPNPHVSPLEPTSPGSPPATSPNMLHARISQEFGLPINVDTNVYPPSSHRSQDPIQPVQSKSVVTTSPSTEISSLQGISRKRGADTPPSASTHRGQIPLPRIRSPSPIKVGIPLHHAWHDCRTDFGFSTERNSKKTRFRETNSRRTSGSTEVLASLAWIGTPYTANRSHHSASPSSVPDRFNMGIAVGDDSISDDVLADRLEKVRRINDPSERGRDVSPSKSSSSAHFSSARGDESTYSLMSSPPSSPPASDQLAKPRDVPLPPPLILKDATSDSEDAAVWQAARKALLCIREIVRTEKKYQEALKMLLNAQTATPPPPSMSPYVSALIRASEILLKRFLEDPSAWGVSTAFVASEDELEETMVSWCAVAGAFFTDRNDPRPSGSIGRWRLCKSGMMSSSSPSSATKRRTSVSLSPQPPPILSVIYTAGKTKERMVEEYCAGQRPQTEADKQTSAVPVREPESRSSRALAGQPPSRKLSVRDLAIQPVQRVMRYVLLYKDLLDCTPATAPPRLLVERALEAATRIANHCDRAQRNPAFCHVS